MQGKFILNCAEFFHQHVHFFLICTSKKIADFIHALFFLKKWIKCRFQYFLDRHSFFQDCMLVKVSGTDVLGPFYFTFVRHQFSCHDTHKRGLTFTVCTDKSDMFSLKKAKRNI